MSIPLAWVAERLSYKRHERRMVAKIEALDGRVFYLDGTPGNWRRREAAQSEVGCLRKIVGEDLFDNGIAVVLDGPGQNARDALSFVASIEGVRILSLRYTNITDEDLSQVVKLRNLEGLQLDGTVVSDCALIQLKVLPQLIHLSLYQCQNVSDSGMDALRRELPRCDVFEP